ncbi:MAG: TetR/AcrR family transcriptional regulator [Bacteroidetes bacterium]|nr:TetR/AcrR family transcriptional regulator [Bacteroidota bacterium]
MGKEENTKERILEAARKIFHQKGLSGARMSEIAEAAEINKAMLHYYFKTKQDLFDHVFLEAFKQIFPQVISIVGSDKNLDEKIREISSFYNQLLTEKPELPVFVLSSIQENADHFVETITQNIPNNSMEIMGKLMMQIAAAHQKGEIRAIDPRHLIINLVAMSIFPFAMKPLLTKIFGMDEAAFQAFITERKTAVAEFVLNSITLKKES